MVIESIYCTNVHVICTYIRPTYIFAAYELMCGYAVERVVFLNITMFCHTMYVRTHVRVCILNIYCVIVMCIHVLMVFLILLPVRRPTYCRYSVRMCLPCYCNVT